MKTVRVAAGVICASDGTDNVLAVQRGYGAMQGLWEFPGGKVERGETAAEACRRELMEELQVRVSDLHDFYTVEYDYPDFHLSMDCFFCHIEEGEPVPSDKQQELRWVSRRSLATLTWMPADKGLIEVLAKSHEEPRAKGEAEGSGADGASADASDGAGAASADAGASDAASANQSSKRSKRTRRTRKGAKKHVDLLDGVDTSQLTAAETSLVRRRAAVRKSMVGNKRKDTKPELLVRQRLRAVGLTGYRLQWKQVPGCPDIAFPGRKIAIFVNGCFWHRCPNCHPRTPKTNTAFWEAKFKRNVERDAAAIRELTAMGWTPITIWECELKRDAIDATMERVIEVVRASEVHTARRTHSTQPDAEA